MDTLNSKEVTAALALTSDYDRIALIDLETGRIESGGNTNIFSPLVLIIYITYISLSVFTFVRINLKITLVNLKIIN